MLTYLVQQGSLREEVEAASHKLAARRVAVRGNGRISVSDHVQTKYYRFRIKGGGDKITLTVKRLNGTTITLNDVDVKTTTIQQVEYRLSEKHGIAPQYLVHAGKKLENKLETLQNCGITQDNTEVTVIEQIRHQPQPVTITLTIHAQIGNYAAEFPMPAQSTQTILQLKNEISRVLQPLLTANNINIEGQRMKLRFNDKEIDDDKQTVQECGIQNGSDVGLTFE